MGMDAAQLLYKDGEIALDPALVLSTGYFGGQAAHMQTTGYVKSCAGIAAASVKYIGMFKNSWTEDSANGNATIVRAGKAIFFNGSNEIDTQDASGNTIEGAPYDTTLTYNPSDYLYIDATSGLWTNVSSSNGAARGIIIVAPSATSGTMEAYMFDIA